MQEMEKKIAQSLLQIKAIKLNPSNYFTWASGWHSPIYCDNRKVLSYPEVRKQVYESFAGVIARKYPENVAITYSADGGDPREQSAKKGA